MMMSYLEGDSLLKDIERSILKDDQEFLSPPTNPNEKG
jgi:hypothetical protein